MQKRIPPKAALYLPIFIFAAVILSILGWIAWINRPLHIAKQPLQYVNNMPLPVMPPQYQLTDSDDQGFPARFYITSRNSTQAISDARRICSMYGFGSAGVSSGETTENGVTYKQATLQCYKGSNDGWQFDIGVFRNMSDYRQTDPTANVSQTSIKSASVTGVSVMSIGAAVTNNISK